MNGTVQQWKLRLKICWRTAGVALALSLQLLVTLMVTPSAQAQTLTVLHSFSGRYGIYPYEGVTRDAKGNLYGTTMFGGTSGLGNVYKLKTNGREEVLYSFKGGTDGAYPDTGLIRDSAGNLYGTTPSGGVGCPFQSPTGCGTVYKVDARGMESVLYAFTGGTDGAAPDAGLIMDAQGNLYGSANNGGDLSCESFVPGCGVIFKVDKNGNETVLHSFTDSPDGANPQGRLLRDATGNLYGTTALGGASGNGTVFKLDTNGTETVLYSFTGTGGDGALPVAGLSRDTAGNLYGTTEDGGTFYGTVFKLTEGGEETVLHVFGAGADGAYPDARVILDAAGNLYGTTPEGGPPNEGIVFKLDSSGNETVLHTFTGGADGAQPNDSLLPDAAGNLYGTAGQGGRIHCSGRKRVGCGVVFKLSLQTPQ
jgi:uncharacterized repeat protein (TIGR03803 family)